MSTETWALPSADAEKIAAAAENGAMIRFMGAHARGREALEQTVECRRTNCRRLDMLRRNRLTDGSRVYKVPSVRPSSLVVATALGFAVVLGACQNSASEELPSPSLRETGISNDAAAPEDAALEGAPPAPACTVTAPATCPDPPVRYADVAPILNQRCVETCHDGQTAAGPWPLTDYPHVADWADAVRDQVLFCTMPPVDAGVPISDAERLAILNWVRCGAPE